MVLEDVSWDFYEQLLKEIGDRPIRVTYDRGRLEMMSPLPEHERVKSVINAMMRLLTMELGLPMACLGSTTFRRKDKLRGTEPDDCYYFKAERRIRGRKRWDAKRDPPPDLVVEVDVTHRSVDREPVYAALGVPEIWRWDGARLAFLALRGQSYEPVQRSATFPFLTASDLSPFIRSIWRQEENAILKKFLAWVRSQNWSE